MTHLREDRPKSLAEGQMSKLAQNSRLEEKQVSQNESLNRVKRQNFNFNSCYVQTCSQTITGRNMRYARALEVVQSEEYLSAADTDIIRRFEDESNFNFNDYEPTNYLSENLTEFENYQSFHGLLSRKKRAQVPAINSLFSTSSFDGYCSYEKANGYAALVTYLNALITSACGSVYTGCCDTYDLPQTSCCGCGYAYPAVVTYSSCVNHVNFNLYSYYSSCYSCASTTTSTTTTAAPNYFEAARNAAPVATAVVAGGMAFMPTMPIVNSQGVPPGNPSPGTPGGGAPPNVNTPNGIAALALVPLGTLPVAIFPPYATPRTRPAVSVIFAESPEIISMNRAMTRFKRSLFRRPGFRRSQRKMSYLDSLLDRAQYAKRKPKQHVDKLWMAKRFVAEIRCLKTKLVMHVLGMKHRMKKHMRYGKKKHRQDRRMNSMDDCFEDMDEPMYGFRSKVMLTENSPCELGVTCRGEPEDGPDSSLDLDGQQGNYNGQNGVVIQESSNYHDGSSTTEKNDSIGESYDDNSIERQTGEDFSSDGPPDCRVVFDPSQCRRI